MKHRQHPTLAHLLEPEQAHDPPPYLPPLGWYSGDEQWASLAFYSCCIAGLRVWVLSLSLPVPCVETALKNMSSHTVNSPRILTWWYSTSYHDVIGVLQHWKDMGSRKETVWNVQNQRLVWGKFFQLPDVAQWAENSVFTRSSEALSWEGQIQDKAYKCIYALRWFFHCDGKWYKTEFIRILSIRQRPTQGVGLTWMFHISCAYSRSYLTHLILRMYGNLS